MIAKDFIWELTPQCNYNCSYCTLRNVEDNMPYSDLETSIKICNFFNNLSLHSEHKIHITLFGGEPTLVPYLKDIVQYLYTLMINNKKISYSIYTNMSADITLYRHLLQNKCSIISTFHMHHMTINEYKYKLEILMKEFPEKTFISTYVIGKNRLNEDEINMFFEDFIIKYKNFNLILIPLIDDSGVYNVKEDIETKTKIGVQNQKNERKDKKYSILDCTNYIMYDGVLARCQQYLDMPILNVTHDKADKLYLNLSKLKFKCNVNLCCYSFEQ